MAASIPRLSNNISTVFPLTKKLMYRWDSVKTILKENYITGEKEITPVQAEKYRGDLFGLLQNELNISQEYLYPHMIVNDYSSPTGYNGERLRFQIINIEQMRTYYRLFIKN